MKELSARQHLENAERRIAHLLSRLAVQGHILGATELELKATKAELYRYRRANLFIRSYRWLCGYSQKATR